VTSPIDAHYTAVLGALNAVLPATHKAYRMGDPAIVTDNASAYTEVVISRRFGGIARADSTLDSDLIRAMTRAVAKSQADADNQATKNRAALEYASLSIGGVTTTPIQFETEDPVAPDDGWYSGATSWSYAH
jgi:hypothetical protein